MNPDICYEVKSYIINVLRIDLTSNEEKINQLNEENSKLIESMSQMAIKQPNVLRDSIVKVKKNDLVYLKVRDVFNKYYKITSPKPVETVEKETKEEKEEELPVIEEKLDESQETYKMEDEGFFGKINGKIKNLFGKGKKQ